eukprot:TRINITY_DN4142_c0_g3_i6.p1 TRINITY_DN4142_c0_g3~~TRINITY_DN4142_c0_g3_i6.p1  ORF type:complete len:2083 (-),score=515.49 TRINITY_DN4142_c0_g3_i6:1406-7654(-)
MELLSDFRLVEVLHEGKRTNVYRVDQKDSGERVILKALKQPHSSNPDDIRNLQREYEIGKLFNSPRIVDILEYRSDTPTAIIERDDGSTSLDRVIPVEGFSLGDFLDIAIQIVEGLVCLHEKEVSHKDIKPSNLLYHIESKQVRITDFGIASLLSEETRSPTQSSFGSLLYMAPEQTGRMNRVVDYRTDFYSLGVTLFHLITGRVPFEKKDTMSLLYCHLAVEPPPVSHLKPFVPVTVSNLIAKLLKKTAEDRYQNAKGILWDLKRIKENPSLEFEIGQNDVMDKLLLSQKIYGRKDQVEKLIRPFLRMCETKKPEVITVTGSGGVGKSTVINEIHKVVTGKGRVLIGKFDQMTKTIAYSAITQAFSGLIRQISAESDEDIERWRNRILNALGANAQLIIEMLPGMESILGKQPPVSFLEPAAAKKRFESTCVKFIAVISEEPLVICLDDLQWADSASLDLVKAVIVSDQVSQLMLIGAYRNNEVDASHPLMISLEELRSLGVTVDQITLSTLDEVTVKTWLLDSFNDSLENAEELSDIIYKKTQGNPFYMKMLLRSLLEEKSLILGDNQKWTWESKNILKMQATENVVDFLISKMSLLPASTQSILSSASCLGNNFKATELAMITEHSATEMNNDIHSICEAGLIYQIEDTIYFAHDKVQEAAYRLSSTEEKQRIHLFIARSLLQLYSLEKSPEKIFDIADHYNAGAALIDDPIERCKLIDLNLQAGKRARNATAYASALKYVTSAISLCGVDAWTERYETTYELYKHKAELSYVTGDYEATEKLAHLILRHARTPVDQADAYLILITQKTMMSRALEATALGRIALNLLDYHIPENDELPAEAKKQTAQVIEALSKVDIQGLIDMKEMQDPVQKAAFRIFVTLLAPTFLSNHDAYSIVVSNAVKLMLEYGHSLGSPLVYGCCCSLLCGVPAYAPLGYELGVIAIKLSDMGNDPSQQSRIHHIFAIFGLPWKRQIREAEAFYQKALQTGIESGENQFSSYSRFGLAQASFQWSEPFRQLLPKLYQYLDFTRKVKSAMPTNSVKAVVIATKMLSGDKHVKLGEGDSKFVAVLRKSDFYSLCSFNILQTQVHVTLRNFEQAQRHCKEAEENILFAEAHFLVAELNFYQSLMLTALYLTAEESERIKYREKISKNQEVMNLWTQNCPQNFEQKWLLVEADIARIENNFGKAVEFYGKAIKAAKRNGFTQDESLALELSGRFWLEHEEESLATTRLKEAIEGYLKWGARAKVTQLRSEFGHLLGSDEAVVAETTLQSTSSMNSVMIDMENVIKASQLISTDLDMSKLLFNMMKIIIETAGAQQGALLLYKSGVLSVDAQYTSQGTIKILEDTNLETWHGPRSVINHVKETRRTVALGRATEDEQFGGDPYITKNSVASLLCMPILKNDELKGLLYLENNLATFAFSQDRTLPLTILTGQMAISLDNVWLIMHKVDAANKIIEQNTRAQEAESYKEKLEEFIDTICHEMRNPLNGIYGGACLLWDLLNDLANEVKRVFPENERLRKLILSANEQLESINQCAQQQKVIVDDVLDLSRLESNKIELNPTSFNLGSLLATIIQMLSPQITQSQLELILNLPEDEVWITADSHRLAQVILNLLSNGVKFTTNGYIEISANVEQSNSGTYLKMTVRDSGIGMTAEETADLFARFKQASRVIQSKYGGSGLGLAICKKLVERMGGNISVESKKWFGSKFTFTIKCEIASKEPEENADHPPLKREPSFSRSTNSTTILIVEDNTVNQRVLMHYLQQQGILCELASNGLEAVEKVAKLQFDLIFLDVEMPVMDGLEASRKIRQLEETKRRKRVPIIGLSGNARSAQIESAMSAGFDDYVTKPFHRDEIYEIIAKWTRPDRLSRSSSKDSSNSSSLIYNSLTECSSDASSDSYATAESLESAKIPGSPELHGNHFVLPKLTSSGSTSLADSPNLERGIRPADLVKMLNASPRTAASPRPLTKAASALNNVSAGAGQHFVVHTFVRHIHQAKSVHVAGNFNNWLRDAEGKFKLDGDAAWYEMKSFGHGKWKLQVPLASGVCNYHFVVNRGERIEVDPENIRPGTPNYSTIIVVSS